METPAVLLSDLNIRFNRASDTLLSQAFDDHPASPAECKRVHDRLLGAWSCCVSARHLFSDAELARLDSFEERVTFTCQTLRAIR